MDSLSCESSVASGRFVERNFATHTLARLKQVPKVEIILAPTFDFCGGVVGPTHVVVAQSILHAIAAARGNPLRNLPLKHEGLRIFLGSSFGVLSVVSVASGRQPIHCSQPLLQ